MLLLRPGELRFAEWAEIDLDGALWTVPSMRMKREPRQKLHGAPHLVPLSPDRARSIDDLPAAGSRAVSVAGPAVGACRGLAAKRR
jgi:integrase